MRVLLVGSGGREHALATAIAASPLLKRLWIAPGNPGTAALGVNVPISSNQTDALVDIALQEAIDLVVVGPEAPLAAGLADRLRARGIAVFGPSAAAARIESSKSFAKALLYEAGVPTAEAFSFADDVAGALQFVQSSGRAWVVKADGLASGKGVVVPADLPATLAAIEQLAATPAGRHLLLETPLRGPEVSVIVLSDGTRLLPLPPARDYKRLRSGNLGPNTGGMGAVAPAPAVDAETYTLIVDTLIAPVLARMHAMGTPFVGALYAGVILTEHGPQILEFNCRFGDPETQVILPLLEGDLLAALHACAHGTLDPQQLDWRDGSCCCVVLAAAGYPEAVQTGAPIHGLEALDDPGVSVYHAGTRWERGQIVADGGRVLGLSAYGPDLSTARRSAYAALEVVHFEGMQYRDDIGL